MAPTYVIYCQYLNNPVGKLDETTYCVMADLRLHCLSSLYVRILMVSMDEPGEICSFYLFYPSKLVN